MTLFVTSHPARFTRELKDRHVSYGVVNGACFLNIVEDEEDVFSLPRLVSLLLENENVYVHDTSIV